jgi:hypothetical protein
MTLTIAFGDVVVSAQDLDVALGVAQRRNDPVDVPGTRLFQVVRPIQERGQERKVEVKGHTLQPRPFPQPGQQSPDAIVVSPAPHHALGAVDVAMLALESSQAVATPMGEATALLFFAPPVESQRKESPSIFVNPYEMIRIHYVAKDLTDELRGAPDSDLAGF